MKDGSKLNIVDEAGNIVGEDTRENIHAQGLLHREVHVWFFTPQRELIFQHRSKTAETYPDLLDATVGGHVEIGDTYESAAIKEMEEETSVKVMTEDLMFVKMLRTTMHDEVTGRINNALRAVYAYRYNGKLDDLRIEVGQGLGFETWPLHKILHVSDSDRPRFIPSIFSDQTLEIFRAISTFN